MCINSYKNEDEDVVDTDKYGDDADVSAAELQSMHLLRSTEYICKRKCFDAKFQLAYFTKYNYHLPCGGQLYPNSYSYCSLLVQRNYAR